MMKKILSFLFFFLFLSFASLSQNQHQSLKFLIDSLQNLIDKNPKQNKEKIKHLNFLARYCFKDDQYIRGYQHLFEGRKLANDLRFDEGEALFLQSLAIAHPTELQFYFFIKYNWFYYSKNIEENLHDSAKELKNMIGSLLGGLVDPDMIDLRRKYTSLNKDEFLRYKHNNTKIDKEISAYISFHVYQYYLHTADSDLALSYLNTAIEEFEALGQSDMGILLNILKFQNFQDQIGAEGINNLETRIIEKIDDLNSIEEAALLNSYLYISYLRANQQTTAIQKALECISQLESVNEDFLSLIVINNLGNRFGMFGMLEKANEYMSRGNDKMLQEMKAGRDKGYGLVISHQYLEIGFNNIELRRLEEADASFQLARQMINSSDELKTDRRLLFRNGDAKGQMEMASGNFEKALQIFHEVDDEYRDIDWIYYVHYYMAECYLELGDYEQSLKYGLMSYDRMRGGSDSNIQIRVRLLLSDVYGKLGDLENSILYLQKFRETITSRNNLNLANQTQKLEVEALIQKSEQDRSILEHQKRNQLMMLGFLGSTLLITAGFLFIVFRSNRQKQKANSELSLTLAELKATQNQLIQSEKMASLGELTAGIAHEIKNPLNFVNNFSELSSELLDEMVEEIEKGDQEEAYAIVDDLKQNLQKILEHGKRADGIVKGMLMHSRGSSGDKEMTDVNALCDEYLRLAYHGLRAKDSTFNAGMETNFDDSLPKIEIVPQEMGRVLLNLITNAFYAVHEKSKTIGETNYQPKVSVSTNTDEGTLTIAVADNGPGIPDDIKKKIFQPFFTTKPTGSGTGLGLSLSYDIVKAHGGRLLTDTDPGKGTTFSIILPLSGEN